MPDTRPLLFFPSPTTVAPRRRGGGSGNFRFPSGERQAARLDPQFQTLERALAQQAVGVSAGASGSAPEQVVVFVTVGGIEKFQRAAELAQLEWLGELDDEDISPDDDFRDEDHPESGLPTRVYLTFANQRALAELLRLWTLWKTQGHAGLPRGYKNWGHLFKQLQAVRTWGPEDRVAETGLLEDLQARAAFDRERIPLQVELWFRRTESARRAAQERISTLIVNSGGTVLANRVLEEIGYHGLLADLPIAAVHVIGQMQDAGLVVAQDVMFYRPCGQGAEPTRASSEPMIGTLRAQPLPSGEPIIAVLDGLPIENHELLAGRVIVDDPDDWSPTHAIRDRQHGTAIASLIVHGDLGEQGPPLETPILVRPVTRTGPNIIGESIPEDQLTVDLIHRAIVRLLDPQNGVARSVRVINISLGDRYYPFHGTLSPWARLLDWLAAKYGVLFVVSAGNDARDLEIAVTRAEAHNATAVELRRHVLTAIANDARHRSVLSPAESVNALTVGAAYSDASGLRPPPDGRELVDDAMLPAPFSRVGLGYRRAIKPDLLIAGGRPWYREHRNGTSNAAFTLMSGPLNSGQLHAWPGSGGSATRHTLRSSGTSNAAALCTRALGLANENLQPLLATAVTAPTPAQHALLLRVLAAHSADWGAGLSHLEAILTPMVGASRVREHAARFLGYGVLRANRLLGCTEQRATALGFASLRDEEAHLFRFPLPPSLSGFRGHRRLTVTLGWFTPIAPSTRRYRRAALWLSVEHSPLRIGRSQANDKASRRGTLQHEIIEGDDVSAFGDDAEIRIQVNCREDAAPLDGEVPYAIACSLEIADGVAVPIYEEVRARIATRVEVHPSGGDSTTPY